MQLFCIWQSTPVQSLPLPEGRCASFLTVLLCGCKRNEELSDPPLCVCLRVNISVVNKAIHGIKFHTWCPFWRTFPLSWLKMMPSQAILWPLSEGIHCSTGWSGVLCLTQARILIRSHCFSATVLCGATLCQPVFLLSLVYIMKYNLFYRKYYWDASSTTFHPELLDCFSHWTHSHRGWTHHLLSRR